MVMPKAQHEQMCYIFCFSYPVDLFKKVLNPVTCWDRCIQKQINLQIIWYFQDHHQIFFINFKSQSPDFPSHQLFSEDFDVVLMQPPTQIHLSTPKKCATLQDRSFCASTGWIFLQKIFRLLKPDQWSVIRAILARVKKLHPHLILTFSTPKPWK